MVELTTARLLLRNWREGDRDIFHEINSHERVMAFFPFRRTRAEADKLMDRIASRIDQTGLGFFAVELRRTQRCIGFAGLADAALPGILPDGTHEVGWRLVHRQWGKGFATEAARALLDHGFNARKLPEIVAFAVGENHRSIAVMQRLGMSHDPTRDFDHPGVSDHHRELKRHVLYAITRDQWQHNRAAT